MRLGTLVFAYSLLADSYPYRHPFTELCKMAWWCFQRAENVNDSQAATDSILVVLLICFNYFCFLILWRFILPCFKDAIKQIFNFKFILSFFVRYEGAFY